MCRLLNLKIKDDTIIQTWKRTSVRNNQELATIAQISKGIISDETIIRNHPWVENLEEEKGRMEEQDNFENYSDAFKKKDGDGLDAEEQ